MNSLLKNDVVYPDSWLKMKVGLAKDCCSFRLLTDMITEAECVVGKVSPPDNEYRSLHPNEFLQCTDDLLGNSFTVYGITTYRVKGLMAIGDYVVEMHGINPLPTLLFFISHE